MWLACWSSHLAAGVVICLSGTLMFGETVPAGAQLCDAAGRGWTGSVVGHKPRGGSNTTNRISASRGPSLLLQLSGGLLLLAGNGRTVLGPWLRRHL
jgi:hypothetical protein